MTRGQALRAHDCTLGPLNDKQGRPSVVAGLPHCFVRGAFAAAPQDEPLDDSGAARCAPRIGASDGPHARYEGDADRPRASSSPRVFCADVSDNWDDDPRVDLGAPGRAIHLCGTFGCTLPNNHRGLHRIPSADQAEGRRKRLKPEKSDVKTGQGRTGASASADAEDEYADAYVDAELPPPPTAAASAHQSAFFELPERERDGGGKKLSADKKQLLCKKTAYCQRFLNHPGRPRTAAG